MNNSTVCPQCGRESINGWLPCKCDHTKAITKCVICGAEYPYGESCPNFWEANHRGKVWSACEPTQDDKLDKIIALLEQIKERL